MMPPERKPIEAAPPPETPPQGTKETGKQPTDASEETRREALRAEFIEEIVGTAERTLLKEKLEATENLFEVTGYVGEAATELYLEKIGLLPPPDSEEAVLGRFFQAVARDKQLLTPVPAYEKSEEEWEPKFVPHRYEPDFVLVRKEDRNGQPHLVIKGSAEVKVKVGKHLRTKAGLKQQLDQSKRLLSHTAECINNLSKEERYRLLEVIGVDLHQPVVIDENFKTYYVTLADDRSETPQWSKRIRLPLTKDGLHKAVARIIGAERLEEMRAEKERLETRARQARMEIPLIQRTLVEPTVQSIFPGLFGEKSQRTDEAILSLAVGRENVTLPSSLQRRYRSLWTGLLKETAKRIRQDAEEKLEVWNKEKWEEMAPELLQDWFQRRRDRIYATIPDEDLEAYQKHFSGLRPQQTLVALSFIGRIYSLRHSLEDRGIELGNPIRESLLEKARS